MEQQNWLNVFRDFDLANSATLATNETVSGSMKERQNHCFSLLFAWFIYKIVPPLI